MHERASPILKAVRYKRFNSLLSISPIPNHSFFRDFELSFGKTVAKTLRGAPSNSQGADGDRNGTDGRRVKSTARSFNPGDDQCPESAD